MPRGQSRELASRRPSWAPLVIAVLALVLLTGAATARAAYRMGARPSVPGGAHRVGPLGGATRLTATVTLDPRDPAALAAYAQAVSTPGTSAFHDYLTVAEFARRFGPSPAAVQAVESSLRARGLMPGPLSVNRLSFVVSAPAARMARAFSTAFERYRLAGGGAAFGNTVAPALPAAAARLVQNVIGLSSLGRRQPLDQSQSQSQSQSRSRSQGLAPGAARSPAAASPPSAGPSPCAAAVSHGNTDGSLTANQLASAYRFGGLYGQGDLGSGATVAVYELEPYSASDISAYQSCYGTAAHVSNVVVDGGAGTGYGQGEAALDIENVIGLAPQANIQVYEGPNSDSGAYDLYNRIVSDDSAQVVATAWGLCESLASGAGAGAENTLFQEAAVQGQSIFAASGDAGTDDCQTGQVSVDDPASQPFVTGVGGTSLQSLGPPPSESVWDNSDGASGGGVSTLWGRPFYQDASAVAQSAVTCGSSGTRCREVPDVAADADPSSGYVIYYRGRWTTFGGTSAATPLWAALTALADASPACGGAPVGLANAGLYAAAGRNYAGNFDDVTTGQNGFDGLAGYSAGPGYDMASGLGSPNAAALVAALCNDTVTVKTPPAQRNLTGQAASLQLSATSSAGRPIVFASSGLPPGLVLSPSTGRVSGTPSTPGSYTVTVSASDTSGASAQAEFTWLIASPPVTLATPAGQTGRVGVSERLALRGADNQGLVLRYRASGLPVGLAINAGTGVITGRPRTAGRHAVVVTATDSGGASAQASFTWTIAGRPAVSAVALLARSRTHVTLNLRLSAGAYAAAVRGLSLQSRSSGLGFSRHTQDLRHGLSVALRSHQPLPASSRLRQGSLRITLVRTQRAVSIGVSSPELLLGGRLYGQIASGRRPVVRIGLTVTDASGVSTTVIVAVRGRHT